MPQPSSNATAEPGRLVLVVGPSGVGKDSLIDGARAVLAQDPRVAFAVRDITRPSDAGGEAHRAVSEAEFSTIEASGGYMLSWGAHGLRYGVPTANEAARRAGRAIVVNVSRTVIPQARQWFKPLVVVNVTASADLLRRRLTDRGRETAAEIEARVARATDFVVAGPDVVQLANDGTLEAGIAALVAVVRGEIMP